MKQIQIDTTDKTRQVKNFPRLNLAWSMKDPVNIKLKISVDLGSLRQQKKSEKILNINLLQIQEKYENLQNCRSGNRTRHLTA